jgi:hypothetical protein
MAIRRSYTNSWLETWPVLLAVTLLLASSAGAQTQPLAIDVPAVQLSGDIRVDGNPPPVISEESGWIDIDGPTGPWSGFRAGRTVDGAYGPTWVIPTDYQAAYSNIDGIGVTHPINPRAPVGPVVEVGGAGSLDVDVPTVVVTFDLTLDGGTFGTIFSDRAEFSLRHVATGNVVQVGSTDDIPFGVRIVPGVYDLLYHYDTGAFFPKNPNAVIGEALDLSSSQTVSIDVTSARHFLFVDLNGGAWPGSLTAYGILALESADGTDRVEFGPTVQVPLPRIYMIEGSYVLVYEWANGGTDVPINTRAIVDDAVTVARLEPNSVSSESYSNVAMSPLTWDATLDGGPFPTSFTGYGEIFAVDADGNATSLGYTTDLPHTRTLIDGTYDVVYRWRNGGTWMPRNANARVDPGRVVAGPTSAVIDIPLVVAEIDPRHNGETFPASATAYASLELEGADPGDRFPIGPTTQAPLSVGLIPGDYDLIYTVENGANFVPANEGARVAVDLPLTIDGTTLVDITTTTVSPELTLNAQPFPTGSGESADLLLRSPTLGELLLRRTDWTSDPDWPVIDGAYHVEYEYRGGSQIPRNGRQRIGVASVPEPGSSVGLVTGLALLAMLGRGRRAAGGHRSVSRTRQARACHLRPARSSMAAGH